MVFRGDYMSFALNNAQQQAVISNAYNILVLAGAGTGKTAVLTHRIAHLIKNNVPQQAIMALTFSNKAAFNIENRLETLLTYKPKIWSGTFHSIAYRILQIHHQAAGLKANFQILDARAQLRLIASLLEQGHYNHDANLMQNFIQEKKEQGIRSQALAESEAHYQSFYSFYEKSCIELNVVDFSELLLLSYELFLNNNSILEHYQKRFQYILVDEFQDTSDLQYQWLKILGQDILHYFCVGDDDQAIYGWRGAKAETLQYFIKDFKNVELIKLTQNYRSTGYILNTANQVIAFNQQRLGKDLKTSQGLGEKILLNQLKDAKEEADFIAKQVKFWLYKKNIKAAEIAILYRTNAQSRTLEEGLRKENIAYSVYAGVSFFQRAEIQAVLAYLRLIANPSDNEAFHRICNLPPRGLGAKTIDFIMEKQRAKNISLWMISQSIIQEKSLSSRALKSLENFINLIASFQKQEISLSKLLSQVISQTLLLDYYKKQTNGQEREENLQELIQAAYQFEAQFHDKDQDDVIMEFLNYSALSSSEFSTGEGIILASLHAAKGLEFEAVVLAGLEEGLLPHHHAMQQDIKAIEEERRLFYVGLTRAKTYLALSCAEMRIYHGQFYPSQDSRFLSELPQENLFLLTPIAIAEPPPYPLGSEVIHPLFGKGKVINFEGKGQQARVEVAFESSKKWLVIAYANLKLYNS